MAKQSLNSYRLPETAFHWILAAMAAVATSYLHTDKPVTYLRLISEDWHGEYATSLSFLILGLSFALLAWRASGVRRWMWWAIAAGGFFVGMEELSWGQRILGISTPGPLREANLQGEITLHNLVFLPRLHEVAGGILVLWALVSLFVLGRSAQERPDHPFERWGIPLLPFPLIPWFLLASYHFLFYPMIKSDELGEFFFGLALALFAFYNWRRLRFDSASSVGRRLVSALALLLVIAIGAHGLTLLYNGGLGYRLRTAAARDYPNRDMHVQSDLLFEYIYAHPEHLREDTRVEHARLLMDRGEPERARTLLQTALKEAKDESTDPAALRRRGNIQSMMGDSLAAEESLDEAIRLDEAILADATGADRARTLWSLAQSEWIAGRAGLSRERFDEALETAPPAQLANKIRRWGKKRGWQD